MAVAGYQPLFYQEDTISETSPATRFITGAPKYGETMTGTGTCITGNHRSFMMTDMTETGTTTGTMTRGIMVIKTFKILNVACKM